MPSATCGAHYGESAWDSRVRQLLIGSSDLPGPSASVFNAKLIWARVPGTTTGNGIHIVLQIHKAFSHFYLPMALEVDLESDRATHRQKLSQTARTEETRRGMRGAWNMDWPCPGAIRGGSGKR